jgi:hypothetical protein
VQQSRQLCERAAQCSLTFGEQAFGFGRIGGIKSTFRNSHDWHRSSSVGLKADATYVPLFWLAAGRRLAVSS